MVEFGGVHTWDPTLSSVREWTRGPAAVITLSALLLEHQMHNARGPLVIFPYFSSSPPIKPSAARPKISISGVQIRD